MSAVVCVKTVDAVRDAVVASASVLPSGGGSKPALLTTRSPDTVLLDMSSLRGIVEYDPQELTVTVLAGTPVAELRDALVAHGQHLPFDPPLAEAGATIGGVVAAGTTGPSGFGFGSVRDFIIGVRFVDGTGTLVRGGGRVVKNAAGFDLPKLMVGSIGRLGVLVELSFKVFPKPPAQVTAILDLPRTADALEALASIAGSGLPAVALDLIAPTRVAARFAGASERLATQLASLTGHRPQTCLAGEDDARAWREAAELDLVAPGELLIRVALTLRRAHSLIRLVERAGGRVRVSLAGNAAWIAWPASASLEELDRGFEALDATGLVLTGAPDRIVLGKSGHSVFADRVGAALDPDRRFVSV